ncbi:MAG: GNAT family N-acetyltransferase [Dehalococcoidia bacterium]|nr:GNAT family N-acetyltransferase [Dehalococcoidia bacterium]
MEIVSARLRLRRATDEEALHLLRGQAPPALPCAHGYPHPDTPDAFAAQVAGREGFGPWLILRSADGHAVGDIGLAPGEEQGTYTGGYGIAESVRGRGFATEALSALLAALWRHRPDAERVLLDTRVSNNASRRVMEKAGLRQVGQVRGSCFYLIERGASYP